MIRPVYYMCHPLGAATPEATRANLRRAMRWLTCLRKSFPIVTIIAPWIASVLAGDDDADPAQRAAGIEDAKAVVQLCAGVILVGGRVSRWMRIEWHASRSAIDLTHLGDEPPDRLMSEGHDTLALWERA